MLKPLPAVVVAEPMVSEPTEAVCAERFVEEAVVEKKVVEVALAKVVFPENVVVPVNVLLSPSNVDDAAPASELR
jgi:hypothetical protein